MKRKNLLTSMKVWLLLAFCMMATYQAQATGTKANLPTTRANLTNGYIYTVQNSMTISANSSGPGLSVPSGGTVTIYIPKDVTLTVNGSGRYAGIYIPSNSTLIITGEGTLNAKAGNNGYGASGGNGTAGSVWQGTKWSSGNTGHASAGDGGTGGAGGDGGGAAIGGNGGAGGAAVTGPTGVKDRECNIDTFVKTGKSANAGKTGGTGETMGKLYIMGSVKVTGTKGAQQTNPRSTGYDGAMGYYTWSNRYFAGGGGGGGCGGHGYIAPYAIGGGGAGGGSGASGGSGGFEKTGAGKWYDVTGSYGGNGAGYNCTRTQGDHRLASGFTGNYWKGGATAYGGVVGSNGGNGTIYKLTATNNAPTISGNGVTPTNTTTYPSQVQATLTFNINATDGTLGSTSQVVYFGVKMNRINVPTRTGYFFQGYYTAASGGTQVFDADGNPVNVSTFGANTTLYAHWVYTHHDMYWDYTYENGGEYANVSESDPANRIKYARLTFYNANGGVAKKVILTAEEVSNKTEGITADFSTHTTAHASITLATSGNENLVGQDVLIVSTKEQMSNFASYTFEPLATNDANATKAANWSATTDKALHATVLNFTGASGDNIYQQAWQVNIIGLQINPDYIFVKPLFKNAEGNWEEITQVVNNTGVQCAKTLQTTTVIEGMGEQPLTIYTGSYPVWKHDAENNDYEYAIGLVGFILLGKTYYMNTQSEGAWEEHFTSPTNDDDLKYTATTDKTIAYNVSAAIIPVVRFAVDSSKGEALSDGTPFILVKGYGETVTDFATHYSATRDGYTFDGWEDNRDHEIYRTTSSLKIEGAHTVTPAWIANEYSITLDNGKTMESGIVTATYDQTLPAITIPVRTGYTFDGYFTEVEGAGTQYYDANGNSTITWQSTEGITLYAKWTANTYTIHLNNGEMEEDGNITATYDQPWPSLSVGHHDGWQLTGYFDEADGQGKQYYSGDGNVMLAEGEEDIWTLTSDLTLYAYWEDISNPEVEIIVTDQNGAQSNLNDWNSNSNSVAYTDNTDCEVNENLPNNVFVKQNDGSYKANSLSLTDGQEFKLPIAMSDATASANSVSFVRNLSKQWGTICLPFDIKIDNEKNPYDYYTVSNIGSDGSLNITKLEGTLSAGTPAIFRVNSDEIADGSYDWELSESNANVSIQLPEQPSTGGLTLTGTYKLLYLAEKGKARVNHQGYFINNNTFWNIESLHEANPNSNIKLSPFRAFLKGTVASNAPQLRIGMEESSAIETLEALFEGIAECYDLNGNKVEMKDQGIYVVKHGDKSTKVIIR